MLPASLGALSLDAPPLFLDLLALPRPLALAIFALLPVDTRLRCSEVSRAWRALLADTSLWTRLDLCSTSGVRFSEALFRAAVAKAGGQLRFFFFWRLHLRAFVTCGHTQRTWSRPPLPP